MKFIGKFVALTMVFATALIALPSAAYANTAPNTFTPVGTSWVDVPAVDRVYLEHFGRQANYSSSNLFFIPAGITCTLRGTTATGPFLVGEDLTSSDCNGYNPPSSNNASIGGSPFGFSINFFGQNYSSAWPSIDGGVFFNPPANQVSRFSMPQLIRQGEATAMFALGADLEYVPGFSNFWTAQTMVDGLPAVVFSWEKFKTLDTTAQGPTGEVSVQLVLLDAGSGNFNAYFNFDNVIVPDSQNGYASKGFFFDMKNDVTVGSNIVHSNDAADITSTCTLARKRSYGNSSDSQNNVIGNNTVYYKLNSLSSNTVSLWSNSGCTAPLNITFLQNEATSRKFYYELHDDSRSQYSFPIGWGTLNPTTNVYDWTELQRNVDQRTLVNGGTSPLISQSLNTTVVGRYVIGQRNGSTVLDSATVNNSSSNQQGNQQGSAPGGNNSPQSDAPALAVTGRNDLPYLASGLVLIVAGIVFAGIARRRKA